MTTTARKRRTPQRVKYIEEPDWHISKNIPVALIFALMMQAAGLIWWGSGVTNDIQILKSSVEKLATKAEKRDEKLDQLSGLQRDLKHIADILARLERTVERFQFGKPIPPSIPQRKGTR